MYFKIIPVLVCYEELHRVTRRLNFRKHYLEYCKLSCQMQSKVHERLLIFNANSLQQIALLAKMCPSIQFPAYINTNHSRLAINRTENYLFCPRVVVAVKDQRTYVTLAVKNKEELHGFQIKAWFHVVLSYPVNVLKYSINR